MDNWSQVKNAYVNREGNLRELSERFDLSYETLRRRAAKEGWRELRAVSQSASEVLERQLMITNRLLDVAVGALDDPDELYIWVEPVKSASGGFSAERLNALNEARFGRLVKTIADIFELQFAALQIPCYKERHDAENAEKKLELELLKLENAAGQNIMCDDGFLEALGGDGAV